MSMTKNILMISLLAVAAQNAHASSSQLFFDNVSGMGNNYAGMAASAEDVGTQYFNPAGLSKTKNSQWVFGSLFARFNGTYRGSDDFTIPFVITIPQSGFVNGQPSYAPFPFVYFGKPVNQKWSAGIGMLTPYGVGAGIPDTSIVRYSGTRAIIYVIDVSPAVSYNVNNQLSLGVGLDANRMTYTTVSMFPSFVGGPDGRTRNDASGWGYGIHGGLLYQLNQKTRLGFTYHSQSVLHPHGQSSFVVTPGSVVGNEVVSNNFKFTTRLPPTTTATVFHQLTSQIQLMTTLNYTQWSVIKYSLLKNIAVAGPAQQDALSPRFYRDTWRFAVGSNYQLNEKWMLRFGVAYENDPTNSNDRSIIDPGTASTSLAMGAHYQALKTLGIDGGLMHYFMNNSSIHTVNGLNVENGTETLQRDAIGLQFTWDMV